jgi:hypothetical protein
MTNHEDDWGEIERALMAPPPAAPAAFTDRVMARIAQERRAQVFVHADGWYRPPALSWWIRAAADPAIALALVLAALVLWRAQTLGALVQALVAWLASSISAVAAPLGLAALAHAMPHGVAALAVTLALLPAVAWGSWRLCLWFERTSLPAARTLPSR